jgi:hypothetical protein
LRFGQKKEGPLRPERPLFHAACSSALLRIAAFLIGPLAALLAILTALLLLLFAALFFVALLLLLVGFLVGHSLSPESPSGGMADREGTPGLPAMLHAAARRASGRAAYGTGLIAARILRSSDRFFR